MFILYTDDSIIADPDQQELDAVVADLKKSKL